MNDAADQSESLKPASARSGKRGALIASGVLAVSVLLWWLFFSSHPINLTTAEPPAEKGWQTVKQPFWVKAEAVKTLPQKSQWKGQYVIVVFKNGDPYYQRMIDAAQIQAGKPFDLALKKNGTQYSAAFVELDQGKPGRRLSNTLSFTH
tara:strand:- start:38746 stop:39192 length:447 start_codon:yes stop_codon:yes gene_type:complete